MAKNFFCSINSCNLAASVAKIHLKQSEKKIFSEGLSGKQLIIREQTKHDIR
jgi:hypothetical protein